MVATQERVSVTEQIVDLWKQLPEEYYSESNLEKHFVSPLLNNYLGINFTLTPSNPLIGDGLIPDYLVYKNLDEPPILVIEDKRRDNRSINLTTLSDQAFEKECKENYKLYKEAVGYPERKGNNGIKQYLDKTKVKPEFLAKYGLVFNGDFFQLWRRFDGLILPMTPIQRVTKNSIPELIRQLKYCILEKPKGLVTGIWNRKGGVAKTTNTLNLASVLALHGKKVLLIDFDTQCDLTRALQLNPENYSGHLGQSLTKIHANKLEEARIILSKTIVSREYLNTNRNNFSLNILPGYTEDLEVLGKGISSKKVDPKIQDIVTLGRGGIIKVIQKMIQILSFDYDYIFIDNSPSIDNLTLSILGSCDTVLTPCDYSRKTLHHAADIDNNMLPAIRDFNTKKNKLNYSPLGMGIVFSNCPPNNVSSLEECIQKELKLKVFKGKQYKTRLKIYAQTKLAEYKHRPVVCWSNSPITKLYYDLANEIFLKHNFIKY